MAMAAPKVFVSAEQVIPTEEFAKHGPVHTLRIPRMYVTGVVEAPFGAHFTECPPDYERDEKFQREYAATAKDDDAWQAFRTKYLDLATHDEYVKAIQSREAGK
jgi:glutaconate CoA-transferase subunit A